MTHNTDLIRQTVHFDDQDTRFEILTAPDGRMFVTDETYFRLAAEYDDLYPLEIDPATGLRVMEWEVNFDDGFDDEPVYTSIVTDSTGKIIDSRSVTEDGRVVRDWQHPR